LAAAIGAQIGKPDARVVAAMGDGSFAFCCGEMETITRYNLPITMIVFPIRYLDGLKLVRKPGLMAAIQTWIPPRDRLAR
jgi:acetolactate synthase-1/2/3 large subunit